ncbi:TonB-dependent receptor domain-containing protein [Lentisalinibacter sediminis]|uniref:TonB-dependent receptor domain-containing protein n=1 Tax=Lentisalinibacter sediminis TaxID=2992237 RepID=UPI0038668C3F
MRARLRPLTAASTALLCLLAVPPPASAAGDESDETGAAGDAADVGGDAGAATVETILVTARRVALEAPASTFASPVTALRYDPRIDVQSRGLAEGQADVSVRGGLFENTGFRLGAVNLLDPQTGHYFAELPAPPAMLTAPALLTGADNALGGFNSTVATVGYRFAPLDPGYDAGAGLGTDGLRFLSARAAVRAADDIGAEFAVATSSGDGSRDNGDHDFERYAFRAQRGIAGGQTDLLLAYQDKFYGWPGAYTGFASLPETDHTQTTLAVLNHRQETAGTGWWEAGAWYRNLEDDYDFDRRTAESGVPGAFDHETRAGGIALHGRRDGAAVDLRYSLQATADELVSSTDLTEGPFASRSYASAALMPSMTRPAGAGELEFGLGARLDWTNREGSELLPSAFVAWRQQAAAAERTWRLSWAETSQVPGYTALASPPDGLFGGNPALGRETARTLELGYTHVAESWRAEATVFRRDDDGLVDWTFLSGAPFVRQANPVDVEVLGAELYLACAWSRLTLRAGYAWLDKDADYGTAAVDASYYALNYARQRLTVALEYDFAAAWRLAMDTELRRQADNPLRTGSDDAFAASLALFWRPLARLDLSLVADNVTNSDFREFPGTPAPRRQVSLQARYSW